MFGGVHFFSGGSRYLILHLEEENERKEKKLKEKKNNNNCFVFVCCFMKFETAAALSEGQEITYFGVCLLLQKLADCGL